MYIIFYVYNVVSATTLIVKVGLHLRIAHHFHSVVVSVRLSACNEASNAVQVVQLVGVGRSSQPQPSPKGGLTHQATQGQVVVGGWGSGQLVLPLVLMLFILDVTLSSPTTTDSHLGDCCCPHLMLLLMGLVVMVVVPVTVAALMLGVSTHLGVDGVGVLQLRVGVVHHGSCQLSSSCQLWRGRHRR